MPEASLTTSSARPGPGRAPLKKVFPDHWTFLLREAAMYSVVVLIVTGTFLALFFQPGMRQGVYHGSYTRLGNVPMSQAYASALNISLEVRGGLPVRQIRQLSEIVQRVRDGSPPGCCRRGRDPCRNTTSR
jgi:ubiquinol-cytochrome c reductase cytochrome b subunit